MENSSEEATVELGFKGWVETWLGKEGREDHRKKRGPSMKGETAKRLGTWGQRTKVSIGQDAGEVGWGCWYYIPELARVQLSRATHTDLHPPVIFRLVSSFMLEQWGLMMLHLCFGSHLMFPNISFPFPCCERHTFIRVQMIPLNNQSIWLVLWIVISLAI